MSAVVLAVAKIVAVIPGRFAARFMGNFAYDLSILNCSCVWYKPVRNSKERFHDRWFWKLGTDVNVERWLISRDLI